MSQFSVSVPSAELAQDDLRLDATFYASSVFQAKRTLAACEARGIPVSSIGGFSKGTFNPPPIKRTFTDDKVAGSPYMLPQEMFDFYWEPRKFVLADRMNGIEDWYLHDGWIVLTQSGTVGKPYYATKEADSSVVLSQNAIRIPPNNPATSGYLYAYLSTWIGQTLLKKDEFGITVKHIRPQHVDSIPVPDIPEPIQKTISKKVAHAFQLRAEAIRLLNEAKQDVYDALGAPSECPIGVDAPDADEA